MVEVVGSCGVGGGITVACIAISLPGDSDVGASPCAVRVEYGCCCSSFMLTRRGRVGRGRMGGGNEFGSYCMETSNLESPICCSSDAPCGCPVCMPCYMLVDE